MILDIRDRRWFTFVDSCPDALPFHHPAWADLLAECYGYQPLVLAMTNSAGEIVAGLPVMDTGGLTQRRWISLPFTDYCPLLCKNVPAADVTDALVDEVMSRRPGAFEQHAGLVERGHVYMRTVAVRHTLALYRRPDLLYDQFTKMHRRNIRKAERAGVQIEQGCSSDDVETFYRLHLLTRRRLGIPIQPRRFFSLLMHHLMTRHHLGFIVVARVNHRPVAAAVFLRWKSALIYKYGASDPRFWDYRPNNLLFWKTIQWAYENGYETLDWGRSDLSDRGLREFKNGWGAKEEPLVYSVIADTLPKPSSYSVIRKVMPSLIRHAPLWVCRAIGECMYRYAARVD